VTPLAHEEIQELLGAYALNAVDPDEVELVERHLEECPRCRSEVAGHRDVATRLGNAGGDAPEGLWDRIASHLEETPPPMRLPLPGADHGVIPLAPRRRARSNRMVVAALGVAAALAIGVLGVQVVRQQDQLDRFEAALDDGSMLDPDAASADLQSTDGDVRGSAVLLSNGTGYLMVDELPALEDGRTYQLWGKTSSGVISLGLLGSEPGAILPFQAGEDLDALAITAEEAGGVVQSENAPVVAGGFD
jgi:hypothetical protein